MHTVNFTFNLEAQVSKSSIEERSGVYPPCFLFFYFFDLIAGICDAPSENHDMDYLTIFIVAFSVVNDN